MKLRGLEIKKLSIFYLLIPLSSYLPIFLSSYFLIPLFSQPLDVFRVGERLEYTAKFGFLNIGKMTLKITDTITYQNKRCFQLSSLLNSNPHLGFLFSLNDTIEVYTTQDGLLPVLCEEKINEGKYHNHAKLLFNQDSLFVVYDDTFRLEILKDTRDLLSFWYYLRTISLSEAETIRLVIHKSKQNNKIDCLVSQKEKIKTGLGEFEAIKVVLKTKGKGIFGPKGGMEIWYADDENRYPVQIKTRLKFGSILFKLQDVQN